MPKPIRDVFAPLEEDEEDWSHPSQTLQERLAEGEGGLGPYTVINKAPPGYREFSKAMKAGRTYVPRRKR